LGLRLLVLSEGVFLEVAGGDAILLFQLGCIFNGFQEAINASSITVIHEEAIIEGKEAHTCSLGNDPKHQLVLEYHRVLPYEVTLFQSVKHVQRSILAHDLKINAAVDNEDDLVAVFFKVHDDIVFLDNVFPHVVLDGCQETRLILECIEIIDIAEKFDLEFSPWIIVFERLLLDLGENVGTVVY